MAKGNKVTAIKSEEDWQTESDLRTLMEAEAIEKDPARYKKATALAKKKLLDLASVASEADSGEKC